MSINFEPGQSSRKIKMEDLLAVSEIAFNWAESLDTKNWSQLQSILAPNLTVNLAPSFHFPTLSLTYLQADYTLVLGPGTLWADITAETFIERMQNTIGNPLLSTQHLIGSVKWAVVSETEILATFQLRAMHMRFETEERQAVKAQASGHGKMTHHYSLVDGEWKLSGLKPSMYWREPGFEDVFE